MNGIPGMDMDKTSQLNMSFNEVMAAMIKQGQHKEVRGMTTAALLMAQAEKNVPEHVINALIVSFALSLDKELASIVAPAKQQLALLGISEERVKQAVLSHTAATQQGGTSGKPN